MDLRKNRVVIGAGLFVVLLGVTLWAVNLDERRPSSASEAPALDIDKEMVTSLELTRPSGETVTLSNISGAWRVVSPVDAEADPTNVETALKRLGDLELSRVVATQAENYARLQVDDENAVRVVAKAGDGTLATLAIGKYANGLTMIRLDDHAEVFGASGSLRYAFDRELKAWRNRRVVQVEAADVVSISFVSANGTFRFDRKQDKWVPTEGAKALGEFDPKKVSGLVSTAARLIASDFAAEEVSEARAGLTEPNATVTLEMGDDTEAIVLEIGDASDEPNEVYLRRVGVPTVYVVSQYLADRMRPAADAFAKTEEPADPPPTMPTMPQGGQGQPQLPPEVMRQLQEQIRKQQQAQ
jgi:hypothetical protein